MIAAGLGVALGAPAHANGPGQTIYDNIRSSSTGLWQGWEPPAQPPGAIESYPDVSADAAADSIHVTVVTSSGLWDTECQSSGKWTPWAQPPPPPDLPATDPTGTYQIYSASTPAGAIYFFQIYKGAIYQSVRSPNGSWGTWVQDESVPAGTVSLATTVAGSNSWNIQLVAKTSSGTIWHGVIAPGARDWSWEPPAQVPGGAVAVSAAGLVNGDAEFMAIGGNGLVYHNIRRVDGSWQGWEPLGYQPPAGWYNSDNAVGVSAAADYNGNAQFVIWDTGSSGTTLYHTIRYADGIWQSTGWGKPAMQPAQEPGQPKLCTGSIAIPTFNSRDTDLHLDALCYS
jgi:hypothetical protein